MNYALNGTAWGELPLKEPEIPAFVMRDQSWRETDRRISDMELANRSAAVGKARRKMRAKRRAEERRKKNNAIAAAVVFGTAGLLILVNLIVEVLV